MLELKAILALPKLSELEREVLIEAAIRDQSIEEIAATVGISHRHAQDAKDRALKKMRKLLTEPSA